MGYEVRTEEVAEGETAQRVYSVPSLRLLAPATARLSIHAIVPMKDLSISKSRLAMRLPPPERRALALSMFKAVVMTLCAATSALQRVDVVSRDPLVLNIAAQCGARPLCDPTHDLNAALDIARTAACCAGATALLVVPADVPLITPADIAALVERLHQSAPNGCVLAPNQDESGTNALGMTLPGEMPFLFGAGSFARHREAAHQLGLQVQIYRSPTLAMDIDTPADLHAFTTGALNTGN